MEFRDTFIKTCIIIGTLLGAYLIYRLNELIIVIFVAIIFASTVRPLLDWLRARRLPTTLAVALIYLTAAALIILLLVLAIPPTVNLYVTMLQEGNLANDINYALVSASVYLRRQFALYVPVLVLPDPIRDVLANAEETVSTQAMPFASTAANVAGQILVAVVISVYWLTSRRVIMNNMLRLLPYGHRTMLRNIWLDTEDVLGKYFSSQILLGVIVGVACYVGLLIMRVPNALALAVIAGIMEFVPFVGPTISLIPAVLMALSVSPFSAVGVAVWYTVVQQVEGSWLVPTLMGRTLRLHPLLILIAFFAGFYLNGILGALLAIPIVGVLQVSFRHLYASQADEEPLPSTKETQADDAADATPATDTTDATDTEERLDPATLV